MPILASLVCGFVFGCGLVVSGMIQPGKVLGFLDLFGIPSGTCIEWVAMWRPLEIFLYEWVPMRQRCQILGTLARIPVTIRPK